MEFINYIIIIFFLIISIYQVSFMELNNIKNILKILIVNWLNTRRINTSSCRKKVWFEHVGPTFTKHLKNKHSLVLTIRYI